MTHISEKMLQAYVSSRLPAKEEQAIMEHMAMCDSCACRFAAYMEKRTLEPPPDLKKEILEETVNRKFPFSIRNGLSGRKGRQGRELLAYSMRVVFAMAASIMILFTMSFQGNTERMPEEIMQSQQKTVYVLTKDGIVKKTASEKASEAAFGKAEEEKDSGREEKKKLTDSLQQASGAFGDALSDFWKPLKRIKEWRKEHGA